MTRILARLARLLPALLLVAAFPAQAQQKRIALSFDDAPRARGPFLTPDERTAKLLASLKKAHVKQAVFFVNPSQIGHGDGINGVAHLDAYVRAGHVIANHSFAHKHLTELSIADYTTGIDDAEAWLKGRPGYRPWYRYPFLDEGGSDKAKRDAIRAALKARGLQNGYVTAEGSDWYLEQLTIEAVKAGKTIDRKALRQQYVETHVEAADFADALMIRTIGRSPAHVMLLHETDLAALYLPDLVRALRRDGWQIITADEAYADPIHDAAPDVPSANGTLTELMAWEKGLPAPRWYVRNKTSVAKALYDEHVLHEKPK